MTLTALDATAGFTVGDLDTSNQVAMTAAYQKMYFCDSRPYSDDIHLSGYHKLDMINTRLVGDFTAAQKDASTTTPSGHVSATPTTWLTQTFTATADYLMNSLRLLLYKSGNPGMVTVSVRNVDPVTTMPVGADLVTATFDGNVLVADSTPSTAIIIPFVTSLAVTTGTVYAIIIKSQFPGLRWLKVASYATGTAGHSTNSGTTWTVDSFDPYFETWATDAFIRGEVVTQATSGATGVFDETVIRSSDQILTVFNAPGPGDFVVGSTLIGSTSGVTCVVLAKTSSTEYVVSTPTGVFTDGENIYDSSAFHNQSNGAADYPIVTGSAETWSLIFRTTHTEFTVGDAVIGSVSGVTFTPSAVVAPPHWLNWTLKQGQFPDGGSDVLALAFGRIFMNAKKNPNQWYATRAGDIDLESGTLDGRLDMLMEQDDVSSPCSSQNTKAGLVGDAVISISAYKDFYVVFGCSKSVWVLIADPLAGGILREVTNYQTGIFSPTSCCWDDQGNFYFLGIDGFYKLSPGAIVNAQPPQNLTKHKLPRLVSDMALNRGTDRVVMAFDKKRYGIAVSVTMQDGTWATNFWIDLRCITSVSKIDYNMMNFAGVFPEVFPSKMASASMLYLDAKDAAERQLLLGCYDGYIRKYDESAKSDDGGNAIVSNVVFGPITDKSRSRGLSTISNVSAVIDPGSDDLDVRLYAASTAKALLNNMAAGNAPDVQRKFEQSSLLPTIRQRVTGGAFAVAVGNEEAGESWSLEKITANVDPAGRIK